MRLALNLPEKILFIFLILLVLLGCENIYLPFTSNETTSFLAFLSLAFLASILIQTDKSYLTNTRLSPLLLCLIIFYTWSALGYFFTERLDLSLKPVIMYLSGIPLALGINFYIKSIGQARRILWVLFLLSGVVALFAIVQQFFPALIKTGEMTGFSSTSFFDNVNIFACFLIIFLPLGVYFYNTSPASRWMAATIFILTVLGLGFSGSPGGQLVAVLELAAIVAWLFYVKSYDDLKFLIFGVSLSLVLYFLLTSFLNSPPEAVTALPSSPDANDLVMRPWIWDHMLNRFRYWTGAVKISQDYFWTGSGPWTFGLLFSYYIPWKQTHHAHNLFLQTASDTGFPGIVLLLLLLAITYRTLWRLFKNTVEENRCLTFFLLVSLSGFLAHNMIETIWYTPCFFFIFTIWISLINTLDT